MFSPITSLKSKRDLFNKAKSAARVKHNVALTILVAESVLKGRRTSVG